jgi:hypothetical protein
MRNAGNIVCGNHKGIGHIEDPDVYGGNSITMNFRYTKCENGDWTDMDEFDRSHPAVLYQYTSILVSL